MNRLGALRLLSGLWLLGLMTPSVGDVTILGPAHNEARATVVLLHGLNRSATSMSTLAGAIADAGYRAVNVDYPSAEHDVFTLSRHVRNVLHRCCPQALSDGMHFVTHSLGGILLRIWIEEQPHQRVRNSVMLGPPNQGSELVDELESSALFKLVTGPAGQQLGTGDDSVPLALGAVTFDVGVIAGRASLNPLYSWVIPGPDDGKVSVPRTQVAGMRDFLVLDVSHSFMMNNPTVIAQTLHFLQHGRFERH